MQKLIPTLFRKELFCGFLDEGSKHSIDERTFHLFYSCHGHRLLNGITLSAKKRKAGVSFVSLFSILLQTESLISRKEKEERRGRSPIAQSRKRRVGLLGSRTTVIATRNESFRSKIVRIRNRPSVQHRPRPPGQVNLEPSFADFSSEYNY